MEDCIFCKIIKKESPATVEFENEEVIAFRSIEPAAEIHVVVTPKKHFKGFLEVDTDTISSLKLAVTELIKQLGLEKGYKLVINGGKYQTIPHFHWHLLAGLPAQAGKLENDVLNKT